MKDLWREEEETEIEEKGHKGGLRGRMKTAHEISMRPQPLLLLTGRVGIGWLDVIKEEVERAMVEDI